MSGDDILDDGALALPADAGSPRIDCEHEVLSPEELAFEHECRENIIRKMVQDNDARKDEHELRKTYIRCSFFLAVGVLFTSLFIATASGLRWIKLSDTVVVTLLTTTTANAIGILLIAFKWLFPAGEAGGSREPGRKVAEG